MEQITIGNIKIDIVRKKIKNIHLAVYPPDGRIRMAVPLSITVETIRLFVISKLNWIKKNQRKFENQERITPREYKQHESHYFLGKRYLLKIIENEQYKKSKVILSSKKFIELHIKPNTSTQKRHEILTAWYRNELKKIVLPLIEKWEKILSVQVNEWNIKQMKTQWGSCNIEKKRIWLNFELIKKPENCIEYVIVHEMLHFFERHHNKRFFYYLDTYLPQWKQLKKQLNELLIEYPE